MIKNRNRYDLDSIIGYALAFIFTFICLTIFFITIPYYKIRTFKELTSCNLSYLEALLDNNYWNSATRKLITEDKITNCQ